MKTCSVCAETKPLTDFYGPYARQTVTTCKSCVPIRNKRLIRLAFDRDPVEFRVKRMWHQAKSRAKHRDVDFSLTKDHIRDAFNVAGDHCPSCGVQFIIKSLSMASRKHAPSLDRIIPEKGYIPENIIIICGHCNTQKGGMNLKEARYFLKIMEEAAARDMS